MIVVYFLRSYCNFRYQNYLKKGYIKTKNINLICDFKKCFFRHF